MGCAGGKGRKNQPGATDCQAPQDGGGWTEPGKKTRTGTPRPNERAHSDHEPEPQETQRRAGCNPAGGGQPGKQTHSGAGAAASARNRAAARAANAAAPRPRNCEAEETKQPGNACLTHDDAPEAHETKTAGADTPSAENCPHNSNAAAKQAGAAARLPPTPKDTNEESR